MAMTDFLKPSINTIRKSIKGIEDSYNNYWDILAELLQNSVDAINKKEDKRGNIFISVDSLKKIISVKDDGVGIEYEKLPILLSPFSTDKDDDFETIGEKGVGLKFVIFQSNDFKLKTRALGSDIVSEVSIKDACAWKKSDDQFILQMDVEKDEKDVDFYGTEIIVKGIENDDLFNLNQDELKFILRTKTAIGNVLELFEDNVNIDISLRFMDSNGIETIEKLPYKYWLPIEGVSKNDIYNLYDFQNWLKEKDRSDIEKRNQLKNKIIYKSGTITHAGYREIKYWSCFVPKRKIWDDLSICDGLIKEEFLSDEDIKQKKFFSTHQPGIYTSVKGMPTGISVEHPTTGYAGYWANIFIIFEDKKLNFDIGRKSINGSVKSIYKEHAKTIFSDYLAYVTKYVSGEPETNDSPIWDRDLIKEEIDSMPELNNSIVKFAKNPSEQEASVAAIFYELVGGGKIDDFLPVISGYRNKYDLYGYWDKHFVVIEFKSHLRNIIRDFDDYVKCSNEIDYIVCWDVNDEDLKALNSVSLTLEEINDSDLFNNVKNYIPVSTHRLIVSPTAKPIYIIDLKKVLHDLSK